MQARITHSFRAAEGTGTRKYTPGDVAAGDAAQVAVDNGWGLEIVPEAGDEADAGTKKKRAPQNKARAAAPENKAG